MIVTDWRLKAVAAAVTVAIIAGAGAAIAWWATSNSYKVDIATLKKEHSDASTAWDREKIAITTRAQQSTADAITRMRQAQDAAAAADKAAQEKLANAKRENDALRNDVADGKRRVRILASSLATAQLAASQHAAGGSASGGGVGDDLQIDLSAEGGSLVLDIRESVRQDAEVIDYLQNYINDVAKQCKR